MIREVLDVVTELARKRMTMLVVTHELSFTRAVADRVIFMDKGTVLEENISEEFFTYPRTQRARDFLDTFNFSF